MCIFNKVPTITEEALHIALNLEALDHSQYTEVKLMAEYHERTAEEVTRKEKYARVAAKPMLLPAAVPTFADISTTAWCTFTVH